MERKKVSGKDPCRDIEDLRIFVEDGEGTMIENRYIRDLVKSANAVIPFSVESDEIYDAMDKIRKQVASTIRKGETFSLFINVMAKGRMTKDLVKSAKTFCCDLSDSLNPDMNLFWTASNNSKIKARYRIGVVLANR